MPVLIAIWSCFVWFVPILNSVTMSNHLCNYSLDLAYHYGKHININLIVISHNMISKTNVLLEDAFFFYYSITGNQNAKIQTTAGSIFILWNRMVGILVFLKIISIHLLFCSRIYLVLIVDKWIDKKTWAWPRRSHSRKMKLVVLVYAIDALLSCVLKVLISSWSF